MKWSVLHQSRSSAGSTQDVAIGESMALAQHCADKLNALARKLELDEIVINTWTFDAAARLHSYELLANAFRH